MKSICLVPLISIICLHAFAQKHDSTTAFNVLIGQSFPTGKFAHANDITDNLGPAKGGEFLKLSITHKITNRIAIGAQLQFQRNPLNTNSLEEDLNNGNFFSGFTLIGITYPPPSLPPPPSSSPLKNWIVNKSSWYVASIL